MTPTNAYRLRSVLKISSVISAPKPAAGKSRKNDQRLREALVQDAEHDVDHDDGHDQHQPESLERFLERLSGSLEPRGHRRRQRCSGRLLDGIDGVAKRIAGLQVERQVHRRKLSRVAHRERADAHRDIGHGIERNELSIGRPDVEHRQRRRILLKFRRDLQDDLVLIAGRVNLRDLARPVRIEQRRLNLTDGQPERGDPVAVEGDLELRIVQPQIAVDVLDARNLAHRLFEDRRGTVKLGGIRYPAA